MLTTSCLFLPLIGLAATVAGDACVVGGPESRVSAGKRCYDRASGAWNSNSANNGICVFRAAARARCKSCVAKAAPKYNRVCTECDETQNCGLTDSTLGQPMAAITFDKRDAQALGKPTATIIWGDGPVNDDGEGPVLGQPTATVIWGLGPEMATAIARCSASLPQQQRSASWEARMRDIQKRPRTFLLGSLDCVSRASPCNETNIDLLSVDIPTICNRAITVCTVCASH